MWQEIFKTFEQCIDDEVFDSLNDAEITLKLLSADEASALWFNKGRAWQWLNTV